MTRAFLPQEEVTDLVQGEVVRKSRWARGWAHPAVGWRVRGRGARGAPGSPSLGGSPQRLNFSATVIRILPVLVFRGKLLGPRPSRARVHRGVTCRRVARPGRHARARALWLRPRAAWPLSWTCPLQSGCGHCPVQRVKDTVSPPAQGGRNKENQAARKSSVRADRSIARASRHDRKRPWAPRLLRLGGGWGGAGGRTGHCSHHTHSGAHPRPLEAGGLQPSGASLEALCGGALQAEWTHRLHSWVGCQHTWVTRGKARTTRRDDDGTVLPFELPSELRSRLHKAAFLERSGNMKHHHHHHQRPGQIQTGACPSQSVGPLGRSAHFSGAFRS